MWVSWFYLSVFSASGDSARKPLGISDTGFWRARCPPGANVIPVTQLTASKLEANTMHRPPTSCLASLFLHPSPNGRGVAAFTTSRPCYSHYYYYYQATSQHQLDVAYCYRSSVLRVWHDHEPCKNSWTNAFWDVDSGGPKEPRIRLGPHRTKWRDNF